MKLHLHHGYISNKLQEPANKKSLDFLDLVHLLRNPNDMTCKSSLQIPNYKPNTPKKAVVKYMRLHSKPSMTKMNCGNLGFPKLGVGPFPGFPMIGSIASWDVNWAETTIMGSKKGALYMGDPSLSLPKNFQRPP